MSKYLGPKLRVLRRLNALPDFTKKLVGNRLMLPGKHQNSAADVVEEGYSSNDDYKAKLIEKQKVIYNYCLTDAKLKCLVFKALKTSNPALSLIVLLELRIDTLLVRYGFCKTIPMARQELNHRRISCNNRLVTSPSYTCKKGDEIAVKGSCKHAFISEIKNLFLIAKDELEDNLEIDDNFTDSDFTEDFESDSSEFSEPYSKSYSEPYVEPEVVSDIQVFGNENDDENDNGEEEIEEIDEEDEEENESTENNEHLEGLTDLETEFLLTDSSFTSYLPSHLELCLKTLSNKIVGLPRREEILLDFDEYKVLEYYFK
jgi:small subunit ribosomal protein S4